MSDIKSIALEAVRLAQVEILKVYSNSMVIEWKADNTPVTIADKKAEEVMREFFMKETPDFGIIGEEFDGKKSASDYNWIIDPIDGTKSFICGVPLFGTLLALYKGNDPLFGSINLPVLNQCLHAETSKGIYLNNNLVTPSPIKEISESLVLSGTLNTIEDLGKGDAFHKLRHDAWLYRGWGDCYGYFMVALGKAQVMYDPVVSIWDIAPMESIFSEAGGEFSFLNGNKLELFDEKGVIIFHPDQYDGLATNGLNHSEILSYFC